MTLFRERPDLLRPFREGESRALEAVYWHYVGRVERILRYGFQLNRDQRRITGASPGDVRDLVQEVFLRAFVESARLRYDGVREYGPYLTAIARNVLADWGRKRGQALFTDELRDDLDLAAPEPDLPATEEQAVLSVVDTYIQSLPEELRAVHRERYELCRSQDAAAEALGISRQRLRTLEGHLRKGLSRALLRAELGESAKNPTGAGSAT